MLKITEPMVACRPMSPKDCLILPELTGSDPDFVFIAHIQGAPNDIVIAIKGIPDHPKKIQKIQLEFISVRGC